MIFRYANDLFDLDKLVAVTDVATNAACRKFAVYLSGRVEPIVYEARIHTESATALVRAHNELLEFWRIFDRDSRTFHYRSEHNAPLLHRMRNVTINLLHLVAVQRVETQEGGGHAFCVYLAGLANPLRVATSASEGEKVDLLKADHDALCNAWADVLPTVNWNRKIMKF